MNETLENSKSNITQTWQSNLSKAREHFKSANNLSYVTFILIKENRLLVKILKELSAATNHLINAFLLYENSMNRVRITRNPVLNLTNFKDKIAPKYLKPEDVSSLITILELSKKHDESAIEFVRKDKFIIMIDDNYEVLTIAKIKELLSHVRNAISAFPQEK